ncbi:MAG: HAMP domain-containing protein [Vicinamibacteria bacterium]|jgi:two-component system phosphate regulon sensor histidine kinase PhoR|nr:HAMP domain-containing protein [Vicinamibacteria bacterium]MBP9946233.1 HAMP domain-containing protein [Vicinamibacteria bacterium]
MNSLRRRLALAGILTSTLALIVVLLIQGRAVDFDTRAETRERLRAEARILAEALSVPWSVQGPGYWVDELVDRAGRSTETRLTVMSLEGTVVGDTTASGDALLAIENHASRPEVRKALSEGEGDDERLSNTAHEDQMYVAARIRHQGRLLGVARASLSLARVQTRSFELQRSLGIALLAVLALASGLAWWLSRPLAAPMSRILDGARAMARGELDRRIREDRDDEFGQLARVLNQAAFGIQEQFAAATRERARFSAVLSAMEDGLLAVDHRGIVLLANEALSRSHKLVGSTGTHYLEVFRQAEIGDLINQVLTSGERRTAEVNLSGSGRSFVLVGVPFPAAPGEAHGAVITFNDVSERQRVDRIRRDFVANASHELRTPLTSIRGFVEALEDGGMEEPETAKRFLSRIRANADRMASLVDDLLELSRLESGAQPPSLEELDCAAVVADVVASFAKIAGRKSITLSARASPVPPVVGDSDRLRRVLEHLVDNALKYTPDGGRVSVQVEPQGAGASVSVHDSGPGIGPEHLPRLFERFYRVDTARSRELGGTGLGLSIVKHLAESMGASVLVTSVPGQGSTFAVRLPGRPPGSGEGPKAA